MDSNNQSSSMNIRSIEKFRETFWDWTPFNECFRPTRIRITDIDGAIERGGHFLFIETKLPGEDVPLGQRIMYDALAKLPQCHVMIIWGQPNKPIAYQIWGYPKKKGGLDAVKDGITRWFKHVDKQVEPLLISFVKEAQREFDNIQAPNWQHSTKPAKKQAAREAA